ncbi:M23 family metallopeptidase [Frigoribacterium sp. Leaf172]|uniref:M23 family metallopeptidase n=1 Tax=Frigoribacterium sp. Leaf172 TaxID=1736285 RepID=UPI0006FE30A7|nr:M23 family metallopeptidase [Frigoribacterium sp. Leaf172]KQR64967.1 hypothetical protein ASF89_11260 [Frigoribacterium sp. Leaf172]
MSKYQNISEPDGDGIPSIGAENDLLVTVSDTPTASITVPTFATRRELREAERAAARAAQGSASAVGSEARASVAAESVVSAPIVTEPAVAAPSVTAPSVMAPVDGVPAHDSRRARRAAEAAAATSARRRPAHPGAPAAPSEPTARRSAAGRPAAGGGATSRSGAVRGASRRPARTTAGSAVAASTASRGSSFRRTSQRVTVVGAMLFAGAMLVATSVPANAFFVDTPELTAAKKAAGAQQSFVAAGAAPEASVSRDGYSVSTIVVNEYASTSSSTFSNDVAGTVQWPFQTGVPISSGFGARQVSNCSFCSTFHQGLDFIPGAGSPIQAIADGTVSAVTGPSGAFGNHVEIEHVVDGQKVTSTYSHMQSGSVAVSVGQTVTVGQIIGAVGSTGNSTGAHLHFEIHLNGVPVDPYPWLTANTN